LGGARLAIAAAEERKKERKIYAKYQMLCFLSYRGIAAAHVLTARAAP
jgi:hypothetical protein